MTAIKRVEVCIPDSVEKLIAERNKLISKNNYQRGDGERLYQIQVMLSSHFCDSIMRAKIL